MGTLSNMMPSMPATPAIMTPNGSAPVQGSPSQAPQFSSPTAQQILQQLLSSYGQQSIGAQQPGSQGQAAGTPGAMGNGQGQSALQQLTGKSAGQWGMQGANSLADYMTGGTGGVGGALSSLFAPAADTSMGAIAASAPAMPSAIGTVLGF
jgi:hypothetical protein